MYSMLLNTASWDAVVTELVFHENEKPRDKKNAPFKLI